MRELDSLEKLIVRSWSAVVALGFVGDPSQVTEELRTRGTVMPMAEVAGHMTRLRALGALPSTLEAA